MKTSAASLYALEKFHLPFVSGFTQSLQNFSSVFTFWEDGVVMVDNDFTILYINKSAQQHINMCYGVKCKTGDNIIAVMPTFRQTPLTNTLTKVLKGASVQYELEIPQSDNSKKWLDCSYYPQKNTHQDVEGVFAILKNISSKKELEIAGAAKRATEKSLYQSRQQFELFMENAPMVAWICSHDGYIHYMNALFRKTFRFQPEDTGKHITELFPAHLAQQYLKGNQQVINTGKPIEVIEEACNANGGVRTVKSFKFPLYHAQHNLIGGWAVDITEQIKLQKDLYSNIERYSYVNEATSDAIYDWDLLDKRIYKGCGFEKLFGYTEQIISLKYLLSCIHPEDLERVKNIVFTSLRNPSIDRWSIEYRIKTKHNSFKDVIDKAFIIRDKERAVRTIGAIQDISEQKELQQMLVHQEKHKKKDIIRSIIETQEKERRQLSVELNDNINQILSSCKLMLEVAIENKDNAQLLTEKSFQNLQIAISEVRKISHSLNPSAIEDIGLMEAVGEMVEKINATRKLQVSFVHHKNKTRPALNAEDNIAIYRIIQEQLNNIEKHSNAKKAVVHLSMQLPSVFICIEDDGQGFEKTKMVTGLGMKSIYNRVEYYNGDITIDTANGKGCKLQVKLNLPNYASR